MFTHRVIPYLKSLADGVIVSRTLKLFGTGVLQEWPSTGRRWRP